MCQNNPFDGSFSSNFQTGLAVRGSLLPEHVLPLKTAVCLVCGGWLYSALIALLFAIVPPKNVDGHNQNECFVLIDLFHKIPRALFAVSVISLGSLIVILQMATYWKLWKQQRTQIGDVSASNHGNIARNKLYKHAMTTSSLIAAAFLVSWVPILTLILVTDWSPYIDESKFRNVVYSMGALGVAQAFSNAIIFKLRNMKFALCTRLCKRGE